MKKSNVQDVFDLIYVSLIGSKCADEMIVHGMLSLHSTMSHRKTRCKNSNKNLQRFRTPWRMVCHPTQNCQTANVCYVHCCVNVLSWMNICWHEVQPNFYCRTEKINQGYAHQIKKWKYWELTKFQPKCFQTQCTIDVNDHSKIQKSELSAADSTRQLFTWL